MRLCNVYLGPGRGSEAYEAMYLLKGHTSAVWSVERDEEVAQVMGHCSTPFRDLTEALRERWPAVRVWVTEEEG